MLAYVKRAPDAAIGKVFAHSGAAPLLAPLNSCSAVGGKARGAKCMASWGTFDTA